MTELPSLAGPRARLDRADALIRALDIELRAFLNTQPYTATRQPDDNPENLRLIIESVEPIPLPLRVMAGEIPHHTRAALDLMVYQLMVKAGVKDDRLLRKSAFPVLVRHDLADPQQKGEYIATIKKAIGPLSEDVRRRIEALQPCSTNREWSHLAQVQELDNTQKHRLLLTGVVGFRMRNFIFHNDGVAVLVPEAFFHVAPGAMMILNGVKPDETVFPNVADAVIFHEAGPPDGWPLGHILQKLNDMTRETVESFADCF